MAKISAANAGAQDSFNNSTLVVAAALLFALTATDLSQIMYVFAGAMAFAFLQMRLPMPAPKRSTKTVEEPVFQKGDQWEHEGTRQPRRMPQARPQCSAKPQPAQPAQPAQRYPETWRPSAKPVAAMSFKSEAFDAAVHELVGQLRPGEATQRATKHLVTFIREEMRPLLPGAEIAACVGANLENVTGGRTSFGVAVPEVEVVVVVSETELAKCLHVGYSQKNDIHKLTKAAIRSCTERLVNTGRFKFRRSAFRSDQPRVNLMASGMLSSGDPLPITLCVNAVSPLFSGALLAEVGRRSPAGRELVLLVRRWAKNRAICHSVKGHMSPYHWGLLAIYFLQVKGAEGVPALPPLKDFQVPTTLEGGCRRCIEDGDEPLAPSGSDDGGTAAAELFKGFFKFYARDFDAAMESVSVRLGRRRAPPTSLALHLARDDNGRVVAGWNIEDPLDPRHNLGEVATVWSLERLREEFVRADRICSEAGSSLSELLETWVPAAEQATC